MRYILPPHFPKDLLISVGGSVSRITHWTLALPNSCTISNAISIELAVFPNSLPTDGQTDIQTDRSDRHETRPDRSGWLCCYRATRRKNTWCLGTLFICAIRNWLHGIYGSVFAPVRSLCCNRSDYKSMQRPRSHTKQQHNCDYVLWIICQIPL